MLRVASKLLSLLDARDRRKIAWLLVAMMLMAALDVAGIFSVMPFMALVANPQALHNQPVLLRFYQWLGASDPGTFIFYAGILTLVLMTMSNLFASFSTWNTLKFVYRQEDVFSQRLLTGYLLKPYTFFLTRNTAELNKNIFSEVSDVVHGILIPGMQALARCFVTLCIFGLLLAVQPGLALVLALVFAGAYGLVYGLSRGPLAAAGRRYQDANSARYKAASQALGGIKEIKLYGREAAFAKYYGDASGPMVGYAASRHIITQLPRYALELVAFGGIMALILYLLAAKHDLDYVLPLLTLYALAGYRLMPALQQIFAAAASVRYYSKALDTLAADIDATQEVHRQAPMATQERLELSRGIKLENLAFSYAEGEAPLIAGLNLDIRVNTTVAFVGTTGAGKTTIIDLIMGLLRPQQGRLLADEVEIGDGNLSAWQRNFGYVPQVIYLTDDSIARNIAFGMADREIDPARVRRAAQLAHLDVFVEKELAQGYETLVGERGVRLSGGQRQRIGIARALYHDPAILVFDEATSALDGATESAVMEALHELASKKTLILIAHRLSSVRESDVIHVLDRGAVVASGSYQQLISGNEKFRSMAMLQSVA